MAWISAVFFCLGAADPWLGDRLGFGSAFRKGFAAVVDLLLLMTGFMALAPWLGAHLAPVITPVFSAVGCDPSLFASLFLSCDAGGAVLAAQIAREPAAGLYSSSALPENNTQNHLSPPNGFSTQEMYGSRHTMRTREAPVNTILQNSAPAGEM